MHSYMPDVGCGCIQVLFFEGKLQATDRAAARLKEWRCYFLESTFCENPVESGASAHSLKSLTKFIRMQAGIWISEHSRNGTGTDTRHVYRIEQRVMPDDQ